MAIKYHASAKPNRNGGFQAIVMVRQGGKMIGSKVSPHAYPDKTMARNYARIAAFRAAAAYRVDFPDVDCEVA